MASFGILLMVLIFTVGAGLIAWDPTVSIPVVMSFLGYISIESSHEDLLFLFVLGAMVISYGSSTIAYRVLSGEADY